MDPRMLFPLLAVLFAGLAIVAWRGPPSRRIAARNWTWLAIAFGAVSVWLHRGPP